MPYGVLPQMPNGGLQIILRSDGKLVKCPHQVDYDDGGVVGLEVDVENMRDWIAVRP